MANRIPQDRDEQARQAREKLTAHRGKATWGERLVPLGSFHQATAGAGRALPDAQRRGEIESYLAPGSDPTPVEGPFSKIAVFGGVYNNHLALAALLEDAERRGAEAVYCLGDLGGFGPNPEKIRPLIEEGGVLSIQGNYEESLSSGAEDCNCGYADPRDNHFAEISYRYTEERCSPDFRAWLGSFPKRRRVRVGERELLMVHGSPRRINEFLFLSASPKAYLRALLRQEACDGFLCTHTGLPWHRRLEPGGGRQDQAEQTGDVVNVGAIGRPANDGTTEVRYCLLEEAGGGIRVKMVPLAYDHTSLAGEMRREELPEEFIETILTGWWTTCLEVLPARERAASRY